MKSLWLQLFQVSKTLDTRGPGFGSGKNRKQQRRKNGDDGNNHQQFNQSEGAVFWPHFVHAAPRYVNDIDL
jgi:hypothetical protein